MAAINMYGQYASPEDEYAALYGALNNPGANAGYSMPAFDPALIAQINGQGSTLANPGAGTEYGVMPSDPYTYTGPNQQGTGLYPGMPQSPAYTAPGGGTNTPPPTPSPNPTYPTGGANSLPMGSENVGGVGMYTGANAPLDTTRFDPQSNMDFVRNIDQVNYYKYVLPFQQRGGDITNPAAVRKAIEDGMRAAGGGQYAVGAQTFNVGGAQPTPNPPSQPVQYSGPQPPLPQQPQLNPAMAYRLPQVDPAMGRPQFQNPFGQVQNPFMQPSGYGVGQPYNGGQQRPMYQYTDPAYPNSQVLSMRYEPQEQYAKQQLMNRLGYGGMSYSGGQNQNQNMQLQQLIANAMARGVMGGQQPSGGGQTNYAYQPGGAGYWQVEASRAGMPFGQIGYYQPQPNQQQLTQGYGQQQPQQQSWSGDPGMNQARMFEMYGGGDGGGGALPQVDFRAATFGGSGTQGGGQSQAPSFAQQFSTPQTNTASASNPWSTLRNDRPSLSNNYNYMWGR